MVDNNSDLQSIFCDVDPEIIANKILNGLKEITDNVITKKWVQIRQRGYQFWTQSLESKRKVAKFNKIAIETNSI